MTGSRQMRASESDRIARKEAIEFRPLCDRSRRPPSRRSSTVGSLVEHQQIVWVGRLADEDKPHRFIVAERLWVESRRQPVRPAQLAIAPVPIDDDYARVPATLVLRHTGDPEQHASVVNPDENMLTHLKARIGLRARARLLRRGWRLRQSLPQFEQHGTTPLPILWSPSR